MFLIQRILAFHGSVEKDVGGPGDEMWKKNAPFLLNVLKA